VSTRTFASASELVDGRLALGLARARTPEGDISSPSFFHGFATHPRSVAHGLITLADITATRYFRAAPTTLRDPVLTAHGDRLRAEVFSADNGVYARLDLAGDALDGGDIARGTTNVDIGDEMRRALALVTNGELLHLDVGSTGLSAATPHAQASERPVKMPDRWVRALGNAAELHRDLERRFDVSAAHARAFLASLPPATATARDGWLSPGPTGIRVSKRPDGVRVAGLHRLSALKRLLTLVTGLTVYGSAAGSAVEAHLPGARLLVALTEEPTRGYSGEGALLESLASPTVLDDAALVSAVLAYEPVISVDALTRETGLGMAAVRDGLAVLASSGRVGWDPREGAHFHRELPDDPERSERDNPRLVRARGIASREGAIRRDGDAFLVDGGNGIHRVSAGRDGRMCTCTWYLRHGSGRGPCAHMLAIDLQETR
jgi:hypothetical protein